MLPELLAWFTGKEQNRRKFPRKRKPYRATYATEAGAAPRPAIGLDISGGGLCMLTQESVMRDEFDIRATLDNKSVRMRVPGRLARQGHASGQDRVPLRYAVHGNSGRRLGHGHPLYDRQTGRRSNKAQDELVTVRMTADDTARLIPKALQDRLLKMLVERRRLAPARSEDHAARAILLLGSGSPQRKVDASLNHPVEARRQAMPTRCTRPRFVFDDNGENVLILNYVRS